jgi:hypothetical protein
MSSDYQRSISRILHITKNSLTGYLNIIQGFLPYLPKIPPFVKGVRGDFRKGGKRIERDKNPPKSSFIKEQTVKGFELWNLPEKFFMTSTK